MSTSICDAAVASYSVKLTMKIGVSVGVVENFQVWEGLCSFKDTSLPFPHIYGFGGRIVQSLSIFEKSCIELDFVTSI